jgi:hypothetical protein
VNRLVRVRDDNVLEVLRTDGTVHLEVRPGYEELLGPCIHVYLVGIHDSTTRMFTLRLASVTELVRKLPIVIAASRRLQNGAKKPAK